MGFKRLPSTVLRRIGAEIYQRRIERNWTQENLAGRAGCTPGYISELERGVKTPSIEAIYGLAATLKISVSDLLRGTDGLSESDMQRDELLKQAILQLERIIDLIRKAL